MPPKRKRPDVAAGVGRAAAEAWLKAEGLGSTAVELKALCDEHGLSTKGTKEQLLLRLYGWIGGPDTPVPDHWPRLNPRLAEVFGQLAEHKGLDTLGGRAFRKIQSIVAYFPEKIESIDQVRGVKGLGASSLKIVAEILATGTCARLAPPDAAQPPAPPSTVLALLRSADGAVPLADLAAALQWTPEAVRAEVERLEQQGQACFMGDADHAAAVGC